MCPHRKPGPSPYLVRCELIGALVPGPESLSYTCSECEDNWVNGSPPVPDNKKTWPWNILSIGGHVFGKRHSCAVSSALKRHRFPVRKQPENIEPSQAVLSHPSPRSRGLGDTVAKALAAVGILKRRGCGCAKRQAWLNRMFPYGH